MTLKIHTALDERRAVALRLLFARFPLQEQAGRIDDALKAAAAGTLPLDQLYLAEQAGLPVGAALVMVQGDGIALVWPPVVACGAENPAAVEDALMQQICTYVDAVPARLSQCLLAIDDEVESAILRRAGFDKAAEMFFLARGITAADQPSPISDEYGFVTFSPGTAGRFERLIELTYVNSLDCPYLAGVRTGAEALTSHQLSGQFVPDRWRLYTRDGHDAGVILLSDHPEQDAVELVYLGVAPEDRGHGLGRRMLRDGLAEAAQRERAVMFLAVDSQNRFANALYSEQNFVELARRQILLRRGARLARQ